MPAYCLRPSFSKQFSFLLIKISRVFTEIAIQRLKAAVEKESAAVVQAAQPSVVGADDPVAATLRANIEMLDARCVRGDSSDNSR